MAQDKAKTPCEPDPLSLTTATIVPFALDSKLHTAG
jgi:hypothetical protein